MAESGTRRATAAGMIGNVLEWYDFAIYGFFAASIGAHYFPDDDPRVSVIAAFGVFAIGFVARPVGALVFGYLGDVLGRRQAMVLSISMMAGPTVLIGVMPTYDTLGVMAPVVLIVLRLLQGASVGGELPGSVTFMLEEVSQRKRDGLVGSWPFSGVVVGVLLGSAAGSLMAATLPADELSAWGWRIPFLAGGVIAIAGFFLRRDLARSGPPPKRPERMPIADVWHHHRWDVVRAVGITAFNSVGFYILFVYTTTFLRQTVGDSASVAFDINTAVMVLAVVLIPVGGRLGDVFGIDRVLLVTSGLGAVLCVPLYMVLDQPDPWLSFLGQLGLVLIASPFIGCFATRMALIFPRAVRMSGFSLAYNVGLTIFGGTAPLVASWLIAHEAGDLSPAYLLAGSGVISFLCLLWARRASPPASEARP